MKHSNARTAVSPAILLISSDSDFTTDHVIAALRRRGQSYCRLNLEDLGRDAVLFDPHNLALRILSSNESFEFRPETLRSIYFRGPSWIRNYTAEDLEPDRLIRRSQGWTFLRSLTSFDGATWVDRPESIYRAEHKLLQLQIASRCGLRIPKTIVSNDASRACEAIQGDLVVVKSLDTVLFSERNQDAFLYTQEVHSKELESADFMGAPAIFQEALEPKTDLRVTVVGKCVHAVEITGGSCPIRGDWRKHKDSVSYRTVTLETTVEAACRNLLNSLDLKYGAIDFARTSNGLYFLEINPVGEWAWIAEAAELPIADEIASLLIEAACG